ncbi:hypothetical protein EJ03DRAFT_331847 [Teratosphaeria nubilosa]|uniref:Secreted protein n=1 Tax=Teratosphaeria nubilosa TaxID=161662 RepID=A0A6G1KV32_9PEZI|nr:hypothetical protein EJ03DRAFT_331847 [Teratosphaeria nubilosa]
MMTPLQPNYNSPRAARVLLLLLLLLQDDTYYLSRDVRSRPVQAIGSSRGGTWLAPTTTPDAPRFARGPALFGTISYGAFSAR